MGRGYIKNQITVGDYLKLPFYVARGIKYHAAGHMYTPKPLWATVNVTHRCNSRCAMCSEWTRQDIGDQLTLAQIGEIFGNPLFDSIERLGISGGEPTLREDLVEIIEAIMNACPRLRHIIINTNGLNTETVIDRITRILALATQKRSYDFTVVISLDGYGDMHETIRRVPGAFDNTSKTINRLKLLQQKIPFYLCLVCVVQPLNIDGLLELAKFSRELELPITFSPVLPSSTVIRDEAVRESLRLQRGYLEKLEQVIKGELQSYLTPSNAVFWREYFNIIDGNKRELPCVMCNYHAGVDCNGTLYMCNADLSLVYGNLYNEPPDRLWYSRRAREMRKKAAEHYCPRCTLLCDMAYSLQVEFFHVAALMLEGKWGKWGNKMNKEKR